MSNHFFLIANAIVYTALGLGLGLVAYYQLPLTVAGWEAQEALVWAASGLSFIMALQSLRMSHK